MALLTTTETASLAAAVAALVPHAELVDVTCLDHPDRSARAGDWTRFDGVIDLVGCGYEPERGSGWLVWLQQLIAHGEKGRLLLLGVTRGLEPFGSTTSNLTGATRAGLYRMLSHEYHQLRARHMDGDASRPEAELAAQIVAEFRAESDALEVCYRAGQRYRARLAPSPELVVDRPSAPVAFPAEHVLLITGGTRGLGALCAQHMVRHYGVKRLVLTGREPWPERAQWKQVGQQDSELAAKIRLVQRLEAEGVQVQVLALRLSDATAVQQSLDAIHTTLGPIGGVLHCAGLIDTDTLAFVRKDPAQLQAVLEPKVAGLTTLYQHLRREPLRFWVLFSSVSGTIPVLASGQADYAMANAYLDYFAAAHQQDGPLVSIQWSNWKEAGMGEVTNRAYRETGLQSLTNAEGLRLLDQLLGERQHAVVLPAVVDLAQWQPETWLRAPSDAARAPRRVAPGGESPVAAPRAEDLVAATHTWLRILFSAELGIEPAHLELDEPVQEYGMDSIILAQIVQRINQQLMVTLDPSILYEYPSIAGFASWLLATHADALAALLAPAASPSPVTTPGVSTGNDAVAPPVVVERPVPPPPQPSWGRQGGLRTGPLCPRQKISR
ncbi:hypothetical protein KDW_41000 [Dictyobacter vulcani]|uniref:Carrier domain-containing protein n=1 Tax=Dictyobacter vulcani TaxID=2607529 RepID=A0A5J4KJN9_9CHLR|nr:beta-ketoacyl reductase [Dictyobacter vulcani]GER89938.1 hypothetical protein KDW_41000 [Dictyobacter vulcani]